MKKTRIFEAGNMSQDKMRQLAYDLGQGAVAVLPTDTVYGIATGALAQQGIEQIYQLKNRPAAMPLQLLAASVEQVRLFARLSTGAEKLASRFWPGALTMVLPPLAAAEPLRRGFAGVGFRVPAHPFLLELLHDMTSPLACTSANLHGQGVITQQEVLLETFMGKVDYILPAGTLSPLASSVVEITDRPRLLREGALSRSVLEETLGCTLEEN